MIRRYAACLTLGVLAAAATTTALARDYVDERGAPVYVQPAPVDHARPSTIVAGTRAGWHGDRYWDGHRWWERDEWNRHHHHHNHGYHHNHHDEDHHG